MCNFICIFFLSLTHTHTHTHIYIYIYIEINLSIYIYIYIYIYIGIVRKERYANHKYVFSHEHLQNQTALRNSGV